MAFASAVLDVEPCAFGWERYRLLSWWDMKPFPVQRLLELFRVFEKAGASTSAQVMTKADVELLLTGLKNIERLCNECLLPSAADQLERMQGLAKEGSQFSSVWKLFPEAMNRIEDECKRHLLMQIEPDYSKYFSNPQFFDPVEPKANKVSVQFPSAGEDIAEAGKCLACGRSTACVMHLGRVVEVGLQTLAATLTVPHQNDWGRYLKEIEAELTKRMKASGARTPDEQFYAEAHLMFDSVRRAWRNPTMHVEKTYTPERAEEILISVRSFMRHLATKLHE